MNDLTFSTDGTRLASTSDDQTAVVWDLGRRRREQRLRLDEPVSARPSRPTARSCTPRESTVRSGSGTWRAPTASSTSLHRRGIRVRVRQPRARRQPHRVRHEAGPPVPRRGSGTYTPFADTGSGYAHAGGAWTPGGGRFASAQGSLLRVWDPATGRVVAETRLAGDPISEVDYSTDGSHLVVAGKSGDVFLLDAQSLEVLGRSVHSAEFACCVSAGRTTAPPSSSSEPAATPRRTSSNPPTSGRP